MEALLTAILEDNRLTARQLLENDPSLATSTVKDARLYESQIYHWLYAGDTALRLAAAGPDRDCKATARGWCSRKLDGESSAQWAIALCLGWLHQCSDVG